MVTKNGSLFQTHSRHPNFQTAVIQIIGLEFNVQGQERCAALSRSVRVDCQVSWLQVFLKLTKDALNFLDGFVNEWQHGQPVVFELEIDPNGNLRSHLIVWHRKLRA